jgi:hypothetical protein
MEASMSAAKGMGVRIPPGVPVIQPSQFPSFHQSPAGEGFDLVSEANGRIPLGAALKFSPSQWTGTARWSFTHSKLPQSAVTMTGSIIGNGAKPTSSSLAPWFPHSR